VPPSAERGKDGVARRLGRWSVVGYDRRMFDRRCALGALITVLASASASAQDAGGGFDGAESFVYREVGGVALRLQVFRPEAAAGPAPAILFFHGGGWVGGPRDQFAPHSRHFASRGIVSISAEYRTLRPHKTTPQDAVADAQAAYRAVVERAADLGVDPSRIAVAGGSAGGHLAAAVACVPPMEVVTGESFLPTPAAMILFNPVLDTGPNGFGRARVGPDGEAISPQHHVRPGLPPTWIGHGTADSTVPFEQAMAFRAAMAAADVRCELEAYPGRAHGFFNASRKTGDFGRTMRSVERFLSSLGWLDGEPQFAEDGTALWHGFVRHDRQVEGRSVVVVAPERPAEGHPWIARARFFGHEPAADLALLERGFHLAYVDVADLYANETALAAWDAAYEAVRAEFGLAERFAFEGMSRGGLLIYRYAARHPERIACLYGDAPVCDIRSWPGGQGVGKGHVPSWNRCLEALGLDEDSAAGFGGNPIDLLAPLAAAGIPILHVCGEADDVVPITENSDVVEQRYRELGGVIDVIRKPGTGHHPHALRDPQPIVDFVLRHTVEGGGVGFLRQGIGPVLRRMQAAGRGRVAFLGGSITHNPGWRDMVGEFLEARLPGVALEFVNAGIPSFGSTPGAFRLREHAFGNGPVDLLFVEAAVNDSTNGRTVAEMVRGYEGVVRAARRTDPQMGIVALHFVDPDKMNAIRKGDVPAVIRAHDGVADRYGIPSLDLATDVTWRIARGEFTWKDDFRDLHPSPFGQKLYAERIGALLDRALAAMDRSPETHGLPSPLDPACYQRGSLVPPSVARVDGDGFRLDPSWRPVDGAGTRAGFVDVPCLIAEEAGAVCELAFDGRACGVLVTAGPDAGVLSWSVDGSPFEEVDLFTRWSRGLHLPWSHVFAAGLEPGPHVLRLRTVERPTDTRGGSAVRIVHFLVDQSQDG